MAPPGGYTLRPMKLLSLLLLSLLASAALSPAESAPRTRFFGEIPFVPAGNFAEFQATMAQTRDEARQELLREFGSLYLPSVEAGADAEGAARALLDVIVTLDRLHAEHVAAASDGIPQALEAQLIAQFDSFFRAEGLAPEERRAEITRIGGWNAAMAKLRAGNLSAAERGALAHDVLASVNYLLYGTFTVVAGGNVILTLTAEDFKTGELHAFQAQGDLAAAVADLARQLFGFAQENARKPWANPQPTLQWILPPPADSGSQLPREAAMFCEGQGARLPFARELVLAAQGGNFRDGGIPAVGEGDIFLVADQERTVERYYYFGVALVGDDPRGPVHTDAGFGTIRPQFACVKGPVSSGVQWEQDLYRAYRHLPASSPARAAIEFLLLRLDAYGSSDRFADRFDSAASAISVLEKSGAIVSDALKAKLDSLE
jgi:hypothetical protein